MVNRFRVTLKGKEFDLWLFWSLGYQSWWSLFRTYQLTWLVAPGILKWESGPAACWAINGCGIEGCWPHEYDLWLFPPGDDPENTEQSFMWLEGYPQPVVIKGQRNSGVLEAAGAGSYGSGTFDWECVL